MKKYFKFFSVAAAMFVSMMFASCSKDEGISPMENQPPSVEKRSDIQSRSFVETRFVKPTATRVGSTQTRFIIFHLLLPTVLLKQEDCIPPRCIILVLLLPFRKDTRLNGAKEFRPAHLSCPARIV